ncbi:endonuclease/exonuclease/phosphatase family protein [Erythrobacter sp. SDW2]|uniref:endonuclease/exonuclease/phosphatase family protein n=1 Tax=Erythrobacter sp. SDW2 TaxID=2907154 RepID=UPI001F397FE6|nr:endonuclease/exonuclease/phosphatase family protein [Erythrobacter sp. SDW2]UIP07163.1 endonuclease/exonuclease/phosphatase family protein [Erythrobacter sp. SDW2]
MKSVLRFASYNIHKAVGLDGVRDPARIITVLREIDADVVALQEADRRFGDRESVLPRAALDDTHWKVVPVARRPRSIGWHGNALLVRRDIDVVESQPLELPTLEPRGAVCALLEHGGATFRIIGTHLDLSGLRRSDQVRAILGHCQDHHADCPAILLGDFNQWTAKSGAIRHFGDWDVIAPGPSFPSRRPVARFDRFAVSPGWKVRGHGVHHSALAAQASDHLPIWLDAQFMGTA